MPEVLFEKLYLLEKRLANVRGEGRKSFVSLVGIVDLHRERFARLAEALFARRPFMSAIISSAVLKGPRVRPALTSASPLANRASMMRRWRGVYSASAFGSFGKMVM